jgi:hypothetical protein
MTSQALTQQSVKRRCQPRAASWDEKKWTPSLQTRMPVRIFRASPDNQRNSSWCVYSDCPGTASEAAGRAAACAGCPNQSLCASAPKGPDPGMYSA